MRSIFTRTFMAMIFTIAATTAAKADGNPEISPLTADGEETEPLQECLETSCGEEFAGLPDEEPDSDPIRLAQLDKNQSGGKTTTVTVEETTPPAPKPEKKVEVKKTPKPTPEKKATTKVEKKPAPKPTTKVTVRTKKSEPPPVVQVEEVGDDTDEEEPPQEVVEDGDSSTTVTVEEVGEESPTPQPEKKKVTVKKTPKPAAKPEESKTSKTTKVTVTKKSEPKPAAKAKKTAKKQPKLVVVEVDEDEDEESDEGASETAEWVIKHLNPTLTGRTFGWQTGTSLSFSIDLALNDYFVVRPYLGYVQLHDSKYFNGRSLTIIPGGTLEHSALNLGLGFGLIDTRNFEVLAVYQLGISPRGWEYQDVFLQAGVRMFKGHLTAGLVIGGTLPNERVGYLQGLYPNGGLVFGPYVSGSL